MGAVIDKPNLQASAGFAVTPHDTNDLSVKGVSLYIGGTGNVKVVLSGDKSEVTFNSVAVGFFPVMVDRVFSTGTTATNIVAVYNKFASRQVGVS